jgi:hypothetical protein
MEADKAGMMLNQLFRQEAIDAYTERWLGEVSVPSVISPATLALIAAVLLGCFLGVLILGSWTRYVVVEGVISGSRQEIVVTASQARGIHVGQSLSLELKSVHAARGPFHARISSIRPSPGTDGSLYHIGLDIPATLGAAAGVRFRLRIPSERRRVYQWMFPCCAG